MCDVTGYEHFSAQTVMSPNKNNQVNTCGTSSIDLLLERGPYGRILLDTTQSAHLRMVHCDVAFPAIHPKVLKEH